MVCLQSVGLGWKTCIYIAPIYSLNIKLTLKCIVKIEMDYIQKAGMEAVSCRKQSKLYH